MAQPPAIVPSYIYIYMYINTQSHYSYSFQSSLVGFGLQAHFSYHDHVQQNLCTQKHITKHSNVYNSLLYL